MVKTLTAELRRDPLTLNLFRFCRREKQRKLRTGTYTRRILDSCDHEGFPPYPPGFLAPLLCDTALSFFVSKDVVLKRPRRWSWSHTEQDYTEFQKKKRRKCQQRERKQRLMLQRHLNLWLTAVDSENQKGRLGYEASACHCCSLVVIGLNNMHCEQVSALNGTPRERQCEHKW